MLNRLIPIAVVAALLLAGCDKSTTATAKDVDKARAEAAVSIDAARQDASKTVDKANDQIADAEQVYAETDEVARDKLTVVESDAMAEKARADFDVASAQATGRHGIAKEKCGALAGVEKDACQSGADATLASEQAAAIASRDVALVQAEQHE